MRTSCKCGGTRKNLGKYIHLSGDIYTHYECPGCHRLATQKVKSSDGCYKIGKTYYTTASLKQLWRLFTPDKAYAMPLNMFQSLLREAAKGQSLHKTKEI